MYMQLSSKTIVTSLIGEPSRGAAEQNVLVNNPEQTPPFALPMSPGGRALGCLKLEREKWCRIQLLGKLNISIVRLLSYFDLRLKAKQKEHESARVFVLFRCSFFFKQKLIC